MFLVSLSCLFFCFLFLNFRGEILKFSFFYLAWIGRFLGLNLIQMSFQQFLRCHLLIKNHAFAEPPRVQKFTLILFRISLLIDLGCRPKRILVVRLWVRVSGMSALSKHGVEAVVWLVHAWCRHRDSTCTLSVAVQVTALNERAFVVLYDHAADLKVYLDSLGYVSRYFS